VAFVAASWSTAHENRVAILERLLTRLEGTLRRGLFADSVEGAHQGRAFRLQLRTRWGLGRTNPVGPLVTRVYPIRVQVDLHHAPDVRLRIRRDRGLAAAEKALGLVRDVDVGGGDRFDQDYLVEADGTTAVTPLASTDVRAAVETLLRRWPLDEVTIHHGRITVRGRPDTVGLRELDGLLEALDVLARAYDRRPGEEVGLAGRFVWVGGVDPQPRCPYCHDGLEGPDALVACGGCRTLIHADCHAENHGCPLLGCGSRGADWARGPTLEKDAAPAGEDVESQFSDEGAVEGDEGGKDDGEELAIPAD
jgi:hypothetical protein